MEYYVIKAEQRTPASGFWTYDPDAKKLWFYHKTPLKRSRAVYTLGNLIGMGYEVSDQPYYGQIDEGF